jgi:hypothetical protein
MIMILDIADFMVKQSETAGPGSQSHSAEGARPVNQDGVSDHFPVTVTVTEVD